MQELYPQKLRLFLNLFPPTVLSSNFKDGGYFSQKSYQALEDNFIQFNSKERINIIAVDIDHHQDGAAWLDYDLPQPTWTVFTDRGVQFSWVLKNPIMLQNNKHINRDYKYVKDVLNKIVYALDADINAIGFNRVFRNPLKHDTHYSDTRIDLGDFSHLDTPSQEWWDRLKNKTKHNPQNDTLFEEITAPKKLISFTGMKEGDGRNIAMFDRLRFWAYSQAKANEYNEFDLAHRALVMNTEFYDPLDGKELNLIIRSIDKFMETKYQRSLYMENTTKQERIEKARENGKKGGAVSAKVKQSEAGDRIHATITQMKSYDIKITVADVARRAKSDPKTVRAHFKKYRWEQKSRKEGWEQKAITISPDYLK